MKDLFLILPVQFLHAKWIETVHCLLFEWFIWSENISCEPDLHWSEMIRVCLLKGSVFSWKLSSLQVQRLCIFPPLLRLQSQSSMFTSCQYEGLYSRFDICSEAFSGFISSLQIIFNRSESICDAICFMRVCDATNEDGALRIGLGLG